MKGNIVKIIIAALIFAWSVFEFIEGHIGSGIGIFLLIAIPVLFIFINERAMLAFYFLRKQNFKKADSILNSLKNPENLIKTQEAYFYFLKGIVEGQISGMGKAEVWFKKALNTGLRMKHNQAMAKLNLAGIAGHKRRKREALILLNQAKKLDTNGMLKDQIKALKQQLQRI